MPKPVPIHINLEDHVQVDACVEIHNYIAAHPELTAGEIRELRQLVHNIRGDEQHDRERRLDQREPKDPHEWGRS